MCCNHQRLPSNNIYVFFKISFMMRSIKKTDSITISCLEPWISPKFLCRVGFCDDWGKLDPLQSLPAMVSNDARRIASRGSSSNQKKFSATFQIGFDLQRTELKHMTRRKEFAFERVVKRSWSCSCVGECNCNGLNFHFISCCTF